MYIHLGQDTVVRSEDVVGIFDLENSTVSKHTRKFLNNAEKKGEKQRVYISQLASSTLLKRSNFLDTK